jgi:hypothetical protein
MRRSKHQLTVAFGLVVFWEQMTSGSVSLLGPLPFCRTQVASPLPLRNAVPSNGLVRRFGQRTVAFGIYGIAGTE